jgi:magnesium transporter
MAEDSTRGIRGVAGTAGSPNDGLTYLGRGWRISPYCVMSFSSIRWPSRIPSISASGRSSTITTKSVFLVVYGAVPDEDRLVEVHCFYSKRFLITVHRDEAPALTEVRNRYEKRRAPIDDPALLLYRIIDALVDSFPILADFDDRIDELENQTFLHASDEQLQDIFGMKRLLVGMRKAVTPQRDLFASLMGGVAELPGMTTEAERHFRDIYDHLIRISDLIDTYRDLLTSSMDVFLSTVSNRLNVVMKQLAVIATVFLPLTFITGFFGQNFGWLVRNIGGWPAFVGLGIGTEIVAVAILMTFFKRRGWF